MKKPWEEEWEPYSPHGYAGFFAKHAGEPHQGSLFEVAAESDGDAARARLAAQAPAMARLLIQILNRVNDPLATEVSDVLEAAGVIKIERLEITL